MEYEYKHIYGNGETITKYSFKNIDVTVMESRLDHTISIESDSMFFNTVKETSFALDGMDCEVSYCSRFRTEKGRTYFGAEISECNKSFIMKDHLPITLECLRMYDKQIDKNKIESRKILDRW